MTHPLRGVLDVGPGVQVGGELVQPVVDVEAALRGGGGRGHGHRAAGRGGGRGGRGGGGGVRRAGGLLLGLPGRQHQRDLLDQVDGVLGGLLGGLLGLGLGGGRGLLRLRLLAEVGKRGSEVGGGDVEPGRGGLGGQRRQLEGRGGGGGWRGGGGGAGGHRGGGGGGGRPGVDRGNGRQQESAWNLVLVLKMR